LKFLYYTILSKDEKLQVDFKNKHLVELYTTGRSRKYPLQSNVIRKFIEVVAILESADDIYDLWNEPSLKFERMKGYENRYSARLNQKWRLEMEIDWENQEKTIGIILITEISKHYGG
jgi:proteic killer suppression protein